jgi:hypothetical protein
MSLSHTIRVLSYHVTTLKVLVKQVILFDMTGVALRSMSDARIAAVHTRVSALSALYYPQLQDAICMTNAPSWLTLVIAAFRKILPKKNMEKLRVFHTAAQLWKSEWGTDVLRKEELPACIGGTMTASEMPSALNGVPGGCEDTTPVQTELTVGQRSFETVTINIPAGAGAITPVTCNFWLLLLGHGVEMSASFTPVGGGG